eukprot:TRINITY_DN9087_c0_g1_i1.p1 TRINITY_DN9087_c0_g1~~TRINITY_DN9087_c0_g1_i1.p1  ORF type:complete len:191 (-),score=52.40 TRINITY_DN9087_c0_g1_i1:95-667(-)
MLVEDKMETIEMNNNQSYNNKNKHDIENQSFDHHYILTIGEPKVSKHINFVGYPLGFIITYKGKEYRGIVIRQFADFTWLRSHLIEKQKNLFVKKELWEEELKKKTNPSQKELQRYDLEWVKFTEYSFPETFATFFGFGETDDKLTKERREAIQNFMQKCAQVKWIRESPEFRRFCSEEEVKNIQKYVSL